MRMKTRRILSYILLVLSLMSLYSGIYLLLVNRGRLPGWPEAFRYCRDPRANRVLGAFFYPVHWLDGRLRGTTWVRSEPSLSLMEMAAKAAKGSLDPWELLSIEYSAVPFGDALRNMSGTVQEVLRGKVSDELAAQGRYEQDVLFTLMRFRITISKLEALVEALGMSEGPWIVEADVRYNFLKQSQSAPGWFGNWSANQPVVAGLAYGTTYQFSFLGMQDRKEQITIFAIIHSWPRSSGDASNAPSQIFWMDQESPTLPSPNPPLPQSQM